MISHDGAAYLLSEGLLYKKLIKPQLKSLSKNTAVGNLKSLFRAANAQTSVSDEYVVDGSAEQVKIDLIIGDLGQSAISIIKLDNTVLKDNHVGSLTNFSIGTNHAIANKFLTITTIITDTSRDTDKTSIDFSIKGGVKSFNTKMERIVQEQGDSVAYDIDIFLHQ